MRLIDADVLSSDLESLETILSKEGWGLVKAVIDRIHLHKTVDVPHWIPVEERLPDKRGKYIVYADTPAESLRGVTIEPWNGGWLGYSDYLSHTGCRCHRRRM